MAARFWFSRFLSLSTSDHRAHLALTSFFDASLHLHLSYLIYLDIYT